MRNPRDIGNSWFTTDLFPEVKKRIERPSRYLDAFDVDKGDLVEAVRKRFQPKDASPQRSGKGRSTAGKP